MSTLSTQGDVVGAQTQTESAVEGSQSNGNFSAIRPHIRDLKGDKLKGKTALITGGSNGIGLATAQLFLKHGANVIITGLNAERLTAARTSFAELGAFVISEQLQPIPVGDIQGGGYALVLESDAGSLAAVDELLQRVKNIFGKFDVLFLNAGVANPMPLELMTEASFDEIFNVNVKNIFFTIQKSIPLLNENSSIILTTSIARIRSSSPFALYASAKSASLTMIKNLSVYLAQQKIRCNAISPGPIKTNMYNKLGMSDDQLADTLRTIESFSPLGCIGEPNDIAQAALFLASEDSRYIVGHEIVVDGGMSEKPLV